MAGSDDETKWAEDGDANWLVSFQRLRDLHGTHCACSNCGAWRLIAKRDVMIAGLTQGYDELRGRCSDLHGKLKQRDARIAELETGLRVILEQTTTDNAVMLGVRVVTRVRAIAEEALKP